MRIELDLSKHCIQKAIKKKYNRLLTQCLASKEADPLREEMLELLKYALETFDFGYLRAQYPALAGHHPETAALVTDNSGQTAITVREETIKPVPASDESP